MVEDELLGYARKDCSSFLHTDVVLNVVLVNPY